MLIQYRVPGHFPRLTEVCDVHANGESMYFIPQKADLGVIKIDFASYRVCEAILNELFQTGRVDITQYQYWTRLD